MPNIVTRVQPPAEWIEELDELVEARVDGDLGAQPADRVASWLAWYAHQLSETHRELVLLRADHATVQRRLDRTTKLAQQLTEIIVAELSQITTSS